MTDSEKFPAVKKNLTKITQELILKLLDNVDLTNAEILDKMKLDQKSASNLCYHLSQLEEKGLIEKIDGKSHKIPELQSNLEDEILEILLTNDCSSKSPDVIKEKMKKPTSLEKILESLKILKRRSSISEFKNEYFVRDHILNINNRCCICKKEFEDNKLIISAIYVDEQGDFQNNRLHALCRTELDKDSDHMWNVHADKCDYCGLSLSVKRLLYKKNENINLDKEIDILFNEPFSKIFSSIDSSSYGVEKLYDINSFAHFKTKNGKQYHPYCFDIIQKKEPKK